MIANVGRNLFLHIEYRVFEWRENPVFKYSVKYMKILIEILNETIGYVLAVFYSLAGLFIRVSDSIKGDKNPVILIPGIMGSPLVFTKLRRRLIKNGYPVYSPWLSWQTANFEDSARVLEQFILDNNLKDIYIIGHASGALIVTQMGYKGRDRIKKFFAISTPFHGTILAFFIYFLPAGRQLLKGSSFLKNNEINFMTFSNLQCLYSRFDLLIVPGFQGKLGRNDDTEYPGLGHINIIMSNYGVNFILDKLELEDHKNEKLKQKIKTNVSKSVPVKKKALDKSTVIKKKPQQGKRAKKKV
jgi:hypothetical protein